MNQNPLLQPSLPAVDIDALLHDSYLLVVNLRQGASTEDGPTLWQLCVEQVEQVRQRLGQAGLSPRSIDSISHAQCALLDETVLTLIKGEAHDHWAREPLQARFFNRHQAGEGLYEQMREAIREPAADRAVLRVFQRVLLLGFRGRYRQADEPEREQLLAALDSQVEPFLPGQRLPSQARRIHRLAHLLRWRSPLAHCLAASLLLVAAWWGLDQLSGGVIDRLLVEQG